MDYKEFLKSKIEINGYSGINIEKDKINPMCFPHQKDAIVWMIKNGQALLGASWGLGKTVIQIEIARLLTERNPGDKFLIVCPLGVKHQFTVNDGPMLGVNFEYVGYDSDIENTDNPFIITNYERVRDGKINPRKHNIIGVSLDEGSILRNLGNKTSDVFLDVFKDVPFKFVATATPAPNQYREIIYYARWLGIMDHGQALTRWFKRDPQKAGNLQIHPQHEEEFWLWVASWALFINKPSDLGYDDTGYDLPKMHVHWHRIKTDHTNAFKFTDNRGQYRLLMDTQMGISEGAKEARATLPARIEKMKEIMASEEKDTHWLLWHHLEDERRAIEKSVPTAKSVYGSLKDELKEERILAFQNGKIPILAVKPQMSGYGCNFQYYCNHNIFLGVSYKFENFIQAVHRTYRFQQDKDVHIHIIYSESEDNVVRVMKAKWERHTNLTDKMRDIVQTYGLSHESLKGGLKRKMGITRQEAKTPYFTAVNNDCVEELKLINDNTFGMIFTSIPFGNHYEYTTQIEDFGHNQDNNEFWDQMDYLIPHLYRTLQPGRIALIHVKDRILYGHQTPTGFMDVAPFSDECVMAFRKHGFLYGGRRTIVTDVVQENASTYRLGWSEMTEGDSTKMGSGLPEYLLCFRKPPTDNSTQRGDVPVIHDKEQYTRARWQVDAHGFWRSSGDRLVSINDHESFVVIKNQYDYEAHVKRLEELDEKGHLPASYFYEPPKSHNDYVWDDVVFMQCLNSNQAARKRRNHICPLPLDIVKRGIEMYSSPGDLVCDPFAGLFTVVYQSVLMDRIGYGIELNSEYWEDGVNYCRLAETNAKAPTLFDLAEFEVK